MLSIPLIFFSFILINNIAKCSESAGQNSELARIDLLQVEAEIESKKAKKYKEQKKEVGKIFKKAHTKIRRESCVISTVMAIATCSIVGLSVLNQSMKDSHKRHTDLESTRSFNLKLGQSMGYVDGCTDYQVYCNLLRESGEIPQNWELSRETTNICHNRMNLLRTSDMLEAHKRREKQQFKTYMKNNKHKKGR